jgi:hypothetical protein
LHRYYLAVIVQSLNDWLLLSQNTNDRGRFVIIKTRLTTKGKEECKRRGDYIYVIKRLVILKQDRSV